MAYIGKSPSQAVRNRYYYTQSSDGATSISGSDDASNTLTFADGNYVDVALNGSTLVAGTDYNTSTANTIAGLSALSSGDVVEVVVYDTFSVFSGNVNGNFTVGGNISVTGTVDGRDVATDGTKLDGIEASATADQTASEIRTLVESASDSNVFTDADHSKLNGIEASADVTDATNVAAAGAAMLTGANFTGSVGIGTTSPSTALDVEGAGVPFSINSNNSNQYKIQLEDAGSVRSYLGASSSAEFVVANSSVSERMRIDSSGNVGIGASTVKHPLHVAYSETGSIPTDHNIGAATDNKNYLGFHNTSNSATYSGLALETRTSGAARWLIANEWKSSFNGDLVFRTRDGGTSGSETVRFTSDGDIGISNNSPSSFSAGNGMPTVVLQGNSSTYTDRSGALCFISQDGSTGKTWMYQDTDMYIQSATNTDMLFYTGNTERMKILSGGNVDLSASHLYFDNGYGIYIGGTSSNNLLAEYERGTWTPTVYKGSDTLSSPNSVHAYYIRLGDILQITFYYYKTGVTVTSSANWKVSGVPFTMKAGSSGGYPAGLCGYINIGGDRTGNGMHRWQANDSQIFTLYGPNANTTVSNQSVEFSGTFVGRLA